MKTGREMAKRATFRSRNFLPRENAKSAKKDGGGGPFFFAISAFFCGQSGHVRIAGRLAPPRPAATYRIAPRCRTASNSVMIVAIATFSESACPAMGINTRASASFSQKSLRPYCSLPITMARGPRRSVSV